MKKLDPKTISQIDHAISLMQFGEIIIIIHEGEIQGIDTKTRKRLLDNNVHNGVDSK